MRFFLLLTSQITGPYPDITRSQSQSGSNQPPPVTPLLQALIAPPTSSPLDIAAVTRTHLATLLFADLVRFSSRAKALARSIFPPQHLNNSQDSGGSFFVPADGGPPPAAAAPEPEPEDEDEPQSLLQIISEHLALALLSRRRADTSEKEAREWDRLIVGYLCLLAQWLWEDPPTVRAFLEAGALGMVRRLYHRSTSFVADAASAGRAYKPSTRRRRAHTWPMRVRPRTDIRVQQRTRRDYSVRFLSSSLSPDSPSNTPPT